MPAPFNSRITRRALVAGVGATLAAPRALLAQEKATLRIASFMPPAGFVVLAAESAKFGSAFAQLGFSCDSGSSATLTARLGVARARRFVMLAEVLSSAEAAQAGLVDRVVADAQLQDEALALARRLADGPTVALGEIKRLFLRAGAAQLSGQLEDEALTLARVAASADAQEGITAMVERRKPVFRGR